MIKIKHIEGFSIKNDNPNKNNEDQFVIKDHLYAVLDGATGQGGLDGKLASEIMKNVLETKEKDESLRDVVRRANNKLAEVAVEKFEQKIREGELPQDVVDKYNQGLANLKQAHPDRELLATEKVTCIEPAYSTATCGAIILIDPEKEIAEIVQVGDCMVAVQRRNGKVNVLKKDLVAHSDYYSYLDYQNNFYNLFRELEELLASSEDPAIKREIESSDTPESIRRKISFLKHLSFVNWFYNLSQEEQEAIYKQVRGSIKSTLRIGRANANNPISPYSYPVFNGTPLKLRKHYRKIPLRNVQSIVLLSDGLLISQPRISQNTNKAWQMTAEAAFKKGLKGLLQIVQWQTMVDPNALYFPDRLKPGDDKTILKIDIERSLQNEFPKPFLPVPSIYDIGDQSSVIRTEPEVPHRGR